MEFSGKYVNAKEMLNLLEVSRTTLHRMEKKGMNYENTRKNKMYNVLDVSKWLIEDKNLIEYPYFEKLYFNLINNYIKYKRTNGVCELCNEEPKFNDKHGNPFLKIYQMDSDLRNIAVLCSSCFDKMNELTLIKDVDFLKDKIKEYEKEYFTD